MDLFVPQVWVPSYWEFFHTSLFQYPENPTIGIKKIYYNMINISPSENLNGIYYNPTFFNYSITPITSLAGKINTNQGLNVLAGESTDTLNSTMYVFFNKAKIVLSDQFAQMFQNKLWHSDIIV